MLEECIFCKIVGGEIPSYTVYEDKKILAFLDVNPVNFGHVLIIPKEHYEAMGETPDEILCLIFSRAKILMKAIKGAMNADYVAVSVVGVDVPHFHVHLIPRYSGDGMASFWPTKKYEEGQAKEVGEDIKKCL